MKNIIFCVAVLISGLLFSCNAFAGTSDEDLLAQLVRAEAGNQPIEGKQAVVDVILNRVDSPLFPNTIEDVIFQPGQFECVSNGSFRKALYLVDDSDRKAVMTEQDIRSFDDIYFFNSGSKCENGEFVMKIGDHIFGTI